MGYASGLVEGVIKKLSKLVIFYSPLTLDFLFTMCCLVLSVWKYPGYIQHTHKLSATSDKKKIEFLPLRQLHKRLAYVKNTELSPCECHTINQIPDLVSLLPVKWWYSSNPLHWRVPAMREVRPSALICFRIACFRHFLYIPWGKLLLLRALARDTVQTRQQLFGEGSSEQI